MRRDGLNSLPWLAISIGIATAIGAALDHLAIGVGIGAGLGAALSGLSARRAC